MSIVIEKKRGIAIVTPQGEISSESIVRELVEMMEHPDFQLHMPSLWDLSEAVVSRIKSDDLRQIAKFIAAKYGSLRKGARVAMVAPGDTAFGLSRMYEMLSDQVLPVQLKSFRTLADAEEWLTSAA